MPTYENPVLRISLVGFALAAALISTTAAAKDDDAVATITKLEHESVKAELAKDKTFYEKNVTDDYTMGNSRGGWETRHSILKDMDDPATKGTKSEISELKVRVYGDTAVATYDYYYEAVIRGEPRTANLIVTDTWVKQNSAWKLAATHASKKATK